REERSSRSRPFFAIASGSGTTGEIQRLPHSEAATIVDVVRLALAHRVTSAVEAEQPHGLQRQCIFLKASASSSKKPAPRKREGRDAASDEHSDVPSGGHARSRRSRHHRGSGSDGDSSEKSNTIRSYHSGSEDGGSVSSSRTSASSTRPDR
ncbi:unnamed protein product, partial [Pylaiella littoralis]